MTSLCTKPLVTLTLHLSPPPPSFLCPFSSALYLKESSTISAGISARGNYSPAPNYVAPSHRVERVLYIQCQWQRNPSGEIVMVFRSSDRLTHFLNRVHLLSSRPETILFLTRPPASLISGPSLILWATRVIFQSFTSIKNGRYEDKSSGSLFSSDHKRRFPISAKTVDVK